MINKCDTKYLVLLIYKEIGLKVNIITETTRYMLVLMIKDLTVLCNCAKMYCFLLPICGNVHFVFSEMI